MGMKMAKGLRVFCAREWATAAPMTACGGTDQNAAAESMRLPRLAGISNLDDELLPLTFTLSRTGSAGASAVRRLLSCRAASVARARASGETVPVKWFGTSSDVNLGC
jgi:hypothetical protein